LLSFPFPLKIEFSFSFFLPPFLSFLQDIHVQTSNVLSEFLREIKAADQVEYSKIAEILIKHVNSKDHATQRTALIWVNEFIILAKELLLPYTSDFLGAILPSISNQVPGERCWFLVDYHLLDYYPSASSPAIKNIASEADAHLMNIVLSTEKEVDFSGAVTVLSRQFANPMEETRMAALEWLIMLHKKAPHKESTLFPPVFLLWERSL